MSETLDAAVQYHQAGRLQPAEELCRMVLQSESDNADALHLLGVIAHQTGRDELAVSLLDRAIENDDRKPQFHNSAGVVLKSLGKVEQAMNAYKRALLVKPDYACAYFNLGNALQAQGRYDAALEQYRRAVALEPDDSAVYHNMAVALQMLGRHAEAVENFSEVVRLKPDDTEAYNAMAGSQQMLGRYSDAIRSFRHILRLEPNCARAHSNLGMVLLLTGNFRDGWAEYAWRPHDSEWEKQHCRGLPQWDGSDFKAKRLLVHYEQGFGDSIQFARYLPMVKARGGTVVFEVRKPLHGLFKNFECIDELVAPSCEPPAGNYDFYVLLLDLPGIFGTTLETIPAKVPYLHAEPQKAAYWSRRLAGDGFKVGIVWGGNPVHQLDNTRSCPLSCFRSLARIPAVRLYGLQKGPAAEQACESSDKIITANLAEQFEDFTDAAAAIENLDLVVSVDTAVLHLAGAMGKPTWALLPFAPDWRWMLNRDDSPWYPTMRLFRQKAPGNWDEVFQRIAGQLKVLVDSRPSKTQKWPNTIS